MDMRATDLTIPVVAARQTLSENQNSDGAAALNRRFPRRLLLMTDCAEKLCPIQLESRFRD